MSLSSFFIHRPIFSWVISITIVIAGLMAARGLPIAQYPAIAPPTVIITANYPGASTETLTRTVAGPIEEQLSSVENLLYFNSTAQSNGTLTITVTFEVGTNVDIATVNVNNRVKIAEPRLPDIVRQFGVTAQKRSNDILLVTALTTPTNEFSSLYLSNYALINVLDELKRVPGVGDAQILGAKDYSMRIWLQPDRMAQLGVTTTDIASAVSSQNKQNVAGACAPSTAVTCAAPELSASAGAAVSPGGATPPPLVFSLVGADGSEYVLPGASDSDGMESLGDLRPSPAV